MYQIHGLSISSNTTKVIYVAEGKRPTNYTLMSFLTSTFHGIKRSMS